MKVKKTKLFLISSVSIAFITAILLFSADVNAAQISFMAGNVKVIKGGKTAPAKFQMKLDSGDTVKTGKNSFADVLYGDGTVIKIKENSSILIGNKSIKGSDSLSLTSGVISAKFTKLQKDSVRKVYTPTTVCAVRGTEFDVAVSDSADSKVKLTEGELDVLNPYGQVKIEENEYTEVNVGKAPQQTDDGDLGQWKDDNENALDRNPEEKSDAFSEYVKNFQKRSDNASKDIKQMEKSKGTAVKGDKDELEKLTEELNRLANDVEDDMYLNSAANSSIDGIINRFKKDKKGMYDKFLKVKMESNKVMDQQKRNFAAIAAVKAAYQKAYDDIMKKHKEGIDKIKGSYDKDSVKPKK